MSEHNYSTLATALQQIPDPRDRRGQEHEWLYILVVMAAALVAGQRGGRAMAQWAREHQGVLVASLQPRQKRVPSAATLYRALAEVPSEEVERHISEYTGELDAADTTAGSVVTAQGEVLCGQSVDGKTVCTASAYGQVHHLVSVTRHESGLVLAQAETAVKLGERKVAQALLTPARLAGTVTTCDALHTQRKQAEQILAGGGHYLMSVKRNQRSLYEALELAFSILPPTTPADAADAAAWGYAQVETVNKGHGRLEVRTLERLTGLNDYLDWPGVKQVLRRTCRRTNLRTGQTTVQVRYAITSLAPDQVSLVQLAQLWRNHWTIENRVHYVRDVSFGEDAGRMRTGNAVEVLAALRNAVIALLRCEGWPCLPTATRHFAAHPQLALQLIGVIAS
jgi:predicted transposase YbfD/YdcC